MSVSVNILGVKISVTDYTRVLKKVQSQIETKSKQYICICAVNQVMQCYHNPKLRRGVNQAVLRLPDGMPLVWLSKLAGHQQAERVYGVTLTEKLMGLAVKQNWKIFLLGGATGQSLQLKKVLTHRWKKLRVVGAVDTPGKKISPRHNQKILVEICQTRPHIVLVGMGCPYQEYWMIQNRSQLETPLLIGVGAVFDYLTGRIYRTPEWVKNLGLEWLFRFFQEPRRLWYRYTIQNIHFIYLLVWRKFSRA